MFSEKNVFLFELATRKKRQIWHGGNSLLPENFNINLSICQGYEFDKSLERSFDVIWFFESPITSYSNYDVLLYKLLSLINPKGGIAVIKFGRFQKSSFLKSLNNISTFEVLHFQEEADSGYLIIVIELLSLKLLKKEALKTSFPSKLKLKFHKRFWSLYCYLKKK
jgi:hypothetical protein